MRPRASFSFLFVFLFFPLMGFAQPRSASEEIPELSLEERVLLLLEGEEGWKPDGQEFLKLGSGADVVLISMVTDSREIPETQRLRALHALSLYPNQRVANFLEAYIYESQKPVLAERAFRSLVSGFAVPDPLRVRRTAVLLSQHQNPVLQQAAFTFLGRNARVLQKK